MVDGNGYDQMMDNLKKVKDLYMTYSAILVGNWIGDLDAIEDQIADLCEKSNIDLLEVIAKIDDENLNQRERYIMSKLSKVSDQLMGLTMSELTEVQKIVQDIKTMKAKTAQSVGARVYVVQKSKKTPGTVRKINQTRAIVTMMGRDYNVPFTMLEAA